MNDAFSAITGAAFWDAFAGNQSLSKARLVNAKTDMLDLIPDMDLKRIIARIQ